MPGAIITAGVGAWGVFSGVSEVGYHAAQLLRSVIWVAGSAAVVTASFVYLAATTGSAGVRFIYRNLATGEEQVVDPKQLALPAPGDDKKVEAETSAAAAADVLATSGAKTSTGATAMVWRWLGYTDNVEAPAAEMKVLPPTSAQERKAP